jgi:hypothetical protein
MTRRSWVPATALVLSSIMALIGAVPRDAMAGIAILSQPTGASSALEEVPAKSRNAAGFAPGPRRDVSVRYWRRVLVLLFIILLVLWLIYRTFTGWKHLVRF